MMPIILYSLTENQLGELMVELCDKVAHQWKSLGVYLNIPMGKLNTIQGKDHECLMEMLHVWLVRINPSPTWDAIIKAIKLLGQERLASKLRSKYCH